MLVSRKSKKKTVKLAKNKSIFYKNKKKLSKNNKIKLVGGKRKKKTKKKKHKNKKVSRKNLYGGTTNLPLDMGTLNKVFTTSSTIIFHNLLTRSI